MRRRTSSLLLIAIALGCSPNWDRKNPVDPGSYNYHAPVEIEWLLIPAGNFIMGSTALDSATWISAGVADEMPQRTVYLDAFSISKYPVTNYQYQAFIDGGGYSDSSHWSAAGWNWRVSNNITAPLYWDSGQNNSGPRYPNYPVVGVSWYEADAFCRWVGGRLPTEAEWEKAARGTNGRPYPWGNLWSGANCNSYDNMYPDTFAQSSPVYYFPSGVSPYGGYDMVGNVWEWVNDWYQNDYYTSAPDSNPPGPASGTYRVVRGGSWLGDCGFDRCAERSSRLPAFWNDLYMIGFRAVM